MSPVGNWPVTGQPLAAADLQGAVEGAMNGNHRPMYAVKLDFNNYIEFARWVTRNQRYKNEDDLEEDIEDKLIELGAMVYEDCDDQGRLVNKRDRVRVNKDRPRRLNVSIPREICRDANGDVDLSYLKDYVRQIQRAASEEDGAWALLGMYFLSRCR